MKILITGNKGFIGQNMVNRLTKDHELYGYELNMTDLPDVRGMDKVIHFGAISSTTERDVDKIINVNLEFSRWLYEECCKHDVHFQYSSSASVYGQTQHFTENGPLRPESPYAWSKYLFDRWLWHEQVVHPITVQGFRYFNVYGQHEDHKGDQASPIHKFAKQIKETGKLKLFEESENFWRDFVCVDDVVDIVLNNDKPSGIYDLGTSNPITFQEVGELVAEKYNGTIEYIPFPEHLEGKYQTYTCAKIGWDYEFTTVEEYLQR